MYPSIQIVARQLTEPLQLPNGLCIPSKCTCFVSIRDLHRDPKYFPNPNVYNPERFGAYSDKLSNPYAYIPFSAGPRNCIGQKYAMQEIKLILASIFRQYKVISKTKPDDVIIRISPGIKPFTKIRIYLEKLAMQ